MLGDYRMKICPNCGTPLERHKEAKKIIWICPICNYRTEDTATDQSVQYGITFKPKSRNDDVIIEDKQRFGALSEVTSCPKCGHSPVYYTFLQTRAADEPPVRLYKCPKCGYSWREYS